MSLFSPRSLEVEAPSNASSHIDLSFFVKPWRTRVVTNIYFNLEVKMSLPLPGQPLPTDRKPMSRIVSVTFKPEATPDDIDAILAQCRGRDGVKSASRNTFPGHEFKACLVLDGPGLIDLILWLQAQDRLVETATEIIRYYQSGTGQGLAAPMPLRTFDCSPPEEPEKIGGTVIVVFKDTTSIDTLERILADFLERRSVLHSERGNQQYVENKFLGVIVLNDQDNVPGLLALLRSMDEVSVAEEYTEYCTRRFGRKS